MTDLNALVIFAKVVEANSFSEAARRLEMPISTVSRRIADLEDELGVRLLERSTRSLRLTDVGSEVFEHAQRSAELSETVDNIVSNKMSNVSGLLRLSAPPSISDTLVAPLVGAFQASYPNVRVQILVSDRFVDHIAEGVDLVFRLAPFKDSSLIARSDLPPSACGESCLPREVQAARSAAGPARSSAARIYALAAVEPLDLCSSEQSGQGNADVSALPFNERLFWACHGPTRGRRYRRPSARGAARPVARRTTRGGHAEMALPHL